jgi:hypothetical protein
MNFERQSYTIVLVANFWIYFLLQKYNMYSTQGYVDSLHQDIMLCRLARYHRLLEILVNILQNPLFSTPLHTLDLLTVSHAPKYKRLWKETQREVRQHWFIYSYISAYIKTLYMYCPGLLEY